MIGRNHPSADTCRLLLGIVNCTVSLIMVRGSLTLLLGSRWKHRLLFGLATLPSRSSRMLTCTLFAWSAFEGKHRWHTCVSAVVDFRLSFPLCLLQGLQLISDWLIEFLPSVSQILDSVSKLCGHGMTNAVCLCPGGP